MRSPSLLQESNTMCKSDEIVIADTLNLPKRRPPAVVFKMSGISKKA